MGEEGMVRFPGNLDPRAQEFRPRYPISPTQIPLFRPPEVYYPYTHPYPSSEVQVLFCEGGVGYPPYPAVTPPAYLSSSHPPPLPPSAAPTRSLMLSTVPSDVSESTVRNELEVFGQVRGVQMERVLEGIVTVHFYDLRHAEMALKEIRDQHMQQQSRLRNHFSAVMMPNSGCVGENFATPLPPPAPGLIAGRPVWAQFIIPATNAVPDGNNQGTIVIFHLDSGVSTGYLKKIFEAYGPVKELRETPLKKHQKFVEFYDIRDAAAALRGMNGKEIHGKHVIIEFSRPGGYSRKFLDANTSSNPPTFTNIIPVINSTTTHHTKNSNYPPPPPPPPSPPPPPPPLPRKFSGRLASNIPTRSYLSQTQPISKKLSDSSKGNPNGNSDTESSIEASVGSLSLGCAVVLGNGIEETESNGPPGRNSKKSQDDSAVVITRQRQPKSKPWKGGRQFKKFDTRFLINEDAMVQSNCRDSRTTVMIKNIPNKYSQKLLLNMLDNHCIHCNEQIADGDQPLSSYDFVYLPIDFNNKCNVGYGFVNMTSPQATWRLYKAFHLQHWEVFNSRKICEVTYARVQGLEGLKEHFKNSKFPSEMDHYLPVVFSPPRDGRQLTEPLPIVGHKLQPLIIGPKSTDDEMDGGDTLENGNHICINSDTDQDDALIGGSSSCISSPNVGGDEDDVGDEDKDRGRVVLLLPN